MKQKVCSYRGVYYMLALGLHVFYALLVSQNLNAWLLSAKKKLTGAGNNAPSPPHTCVTICP